MANIHKDDIGTEIRLQVMKDGEAFPLENALTKQIKMKKPSESILVVDAEFYTDGSDGILTYTTIEDDLDEAGIYAVYAYLELSDTGWKGHTTSYNLPVDDVD